MIMHSLCRIKQHTNIVKKICFKINVELIKKNYDKEVQKVNKEIGLKQYPRTFQEKMMVLNHPNTIKMIQLVEFGASFKQPKIWLPLVLLAAACFGYVLDQLLPIRIIDRYFMISPQSPQFLVSYILASLNYQKPFFLYLPLMLGLNRISRFINIRQMLGLFSINLVIGNVLAQYLVNQRVSKYQMWESERICFGEGNILSLVFSFWATIGLKQGFTHLKSKIFFKAIPGLGVIRQGFPIGALCIIYTFLQAFLYYKGSKNTQVIFTNVIVGIFYGLVMRRFRPIPK